MGLHSIADVALYSCAFVCCCCWLHHKLLLWDNKGSLDPLNPRPESSSSKNSFYISVWLSLWLCGIQPCSWHVYLTHTHTTPLYCDTLQQPCNDIVTTTCMSVSSQIARQQQQLLQQQHKINLLQQQIQVSARAFVGCSDLMCGVLSRGHICRVKRGWDGRQTVPAPPGFWNWSPN